jgi:hypothetical protein
LFLVKYDNQTFKQTKFNIPIPPVDKSVKLTGFGFNGLSDSLIVLTRRNTKSDNEDERHVYVINTIKGSLKTFTYKPTFKTVKGMGGVSYRYGAVPGTLKFVSGRPTVPAEGPSEYGNFRLSKDGKSIYHFCFANFSGKSYRLGGGGYHLEGFQIAKMDLTGKVLWQQETKFTEAELGNLTKFKAHPDGNLTFYEFDDKSIGFDFYYLETAAPGVANHSAIGLQYSADGKRMAFCQKDLKTKGGILKDANTTVKSVEELFPCFITNADRMTKYVQQQKLNAKYSVFTDNGTHILTVLSKDERSMGLVFFKN